MPIRGQWQRLRALLVALVVVLAATVPAVTGWPPDPSVAFATVAHDENDNKNDDDDEDDPDRVARGQVLEINTLKEPPELIVATADGRMVVRVLKTDEIALNGVRTGDHVKLDGEKIHEQLFEAYHISVEDRCRC